MRIKDGLDLPGDSLAVLRTTSLLGREVRRAAAPRSEDGEPAVDAERASSSTADEIERTAQAPELEFVAEEAVEVLGRRRRQRPRHPRRDRRRRLRRPGRRAGQPHRHLSIVSGTLADQTDNIVAIIDGLDRATATLAGGDERGRRSCS